MTRNERKGFTLIEILIVVAIIAILASVVLVGLGPTQRAGRDARRISDLRSIQTGLELYYSKCGYYPGPVIPVGGACAAWAAGQTYAGMSSALTTNNQIGVTTVPNDPSAGANYAYGSFTLGSTYTLGAHLEDSGNAVFRNYVTPANVPAALDCKATSGNYCVTL